MAVHIGIMDFGAQGLYIVYFFWGIKNNELNKPFVRSPPAVNQFNSAIDKNQAGQLLRLLKKFAAGSQLGSLNRLASCKP